MRLHLSDFKSLRMKSRLYARYSDTPAIIAVTRLLYGGLWYLAPSDFNLFVSLKKRLRGHRRLTDAQFEEAV